MEENTGVNIEAIVRSMPDLEAEGTEDPREVLFRKFLNANITAQEAMNLSNMELDMIVMVGTYINTNREVVRECENIIRAVQNATPNTRDIGYI